MKSLLIRKEYLPAELPMGHPVEGNQGAPWAQHSALSKISEALAQKSYYWLPFCIPNMSHITHNEAPISQAIRPTYRISVPMASKATLARLRSTSFALVTSNSKFSFKALSSSEISSSSSISIALPDFYNKEKKTFMCHCSSPWDGFTSPISRHSWILSNTHIFYFILSRSILGTWILFRYHSERVSDRPDQSKQTDLLSDTTDTRYGSIYCD